jgi:hypothetical protein
MSSHPEPERIETLLALAVAFGRETFGETDDELDDERANVAPALSALRVLSALDADDRQALERRAEWYVKLAPEKQERWVARTLGRARHRHTQLDEHIHPSHIIAALNEESARIQTLILHHLPPTLATICTAALQTGATENASSPATNGNAHLPDLSNQKEGLRRRRSDSPLRVEPISPPRNELLMNETLPPEIVELVRETFLSHFVTAGDLRHSTTLDFLSGTELGRLMRLVSVRETALACRGIDRVEAVASFLRRFAAEDARAIASHIAMLTEVEPQRVRFAEKLLHEALSSSPEPAAMLYLIGMRLLALTLTQQGEEHLAYTAQKLPIEAARLLREEAAACCQQYERGMTRRIAREIESLAANLRRPAEHATETSTAPTLPASPNLKQDSTT